MPNNNLEMAMSVLLAAYMSGKKIDIVVEHGVCDAFNCPSVTHVRIRN